VFSLSFNAKPLSLASTCCLWPQSFHSAYSPLINITITHDNHDPESRPPSLLQYNHEPSRCQIPSHFRNRIQPAISPESGPLPRLTGTAHGWCQGKISSRSTTEHHHLIDLVTFSTPTAAHAGSRSTTSAHLVLNVYTATTATTTFIHGTLPNLILRLGLCPNRG